MYAYYKVDKKEQEQEARNKRATGVFYDEPNQKTFFDFLAGQMDDENYLVNPHARKAPSSASIPKKAQNLEALADSKSTSFYQQ